MTSPPPAPVSLAHACPTEPFWDRWCRNASPEQKQHVLPAAIRSGVVQLHQLPVPAPLPNRNAVQPLVAAIIANRVPTLEPVPVADVNVVDAALDEEQRHAVAVALGSPELSLIVGQPGTGKSRVVAEILRQAVGRSERVLFTAPAGFALDRVIDRAADLRPSVVRCPGAGETLPPCSVALSLQGRIGHFDQHTLPTARRRVEEARDQLGRLSAFEETWVRLRSAPTRRDALAARRADLELRRASLSSAVDTAPEQFSPEWADARRNFHERDREIETKLGRLADRIQSERCESLRLEGERGPLASLAESRSSGRWWTLAYWKASLRPDPAPRLAEIDRLLAGHRAEFASLQHENASLEASRRQFHADYDALRRDEVGRRDADLARELRETADAIVAVESEWAAVLPAAVDPAAFEAAEGAWRIELAGASEELEGRREWLSALEGVRPGLAFEFVVGARILAAPVSELVSLGVDRSPGEFDLLIIDDAHRLAEKDFLALVRFAPRCVLVGEPGVTIPKTARQGATRPAEPSSANLLLRLWAALHPDPLRASTLWSRQGERLVARLRPFGPEDESEITREPVFDRPEIELAIRTPPGAEPHIAEVCFPASLPVADAKAFLFRESGELSIQPRASGFRWRDAGDRIHLHFGACDASGDECCPLDAGVVEHLGYASSETAGSAWDTLGLSFARADGWDRPAAAAWVAERLGLRDVGRTAFLSRVHRGRPALASFLSELLFPRSPVPAPRAFGCAAEFVPCGEARDRTALHDGHSAHSAAHANGATALAARPGRPRLGAGHEVDLGDGRRLDAIGPELRSALPPRGLVNLPEARLIVQTLEALVADSPGLPSVGDEPHVAVLSLHPAQVELLRLLVRRSGLLAESGLRILVGPPSALAHRDCPVVCLGLTRSHPSRAVPFSDDPRDLLLALTRATERLLVFGDPGTVARRGQWFGALDHLTEATGPIEQHVLARLLAHLPERAAQARPGVVLESNGV